MRLKMRLTALNPKRDFTLSDLGLGFGLGLVNDTYIYVDKHEFIVILSERHRHTMATDVMVFWALLA